MGVLILATIDLLIVFIGVLRYLPRPVHAPTWSHAQSFSTMRMWGAGALAIAASIEVFGLVVTAH